MYAADEQSLVIVTVLEAHVTLVKNSCYSLKIDLIIFSAALRNYICITKSAVNIQ